MNADETVKALRHCYQEDVQGCEGCLLNENDLCYEVNTELKAADLIESLQKQLAETKRQLEEAVRDLKNAGDCTNCKYNQYPCEREDMGHECWQWRGPEEGENNG